MPYPASTSSSFGSTALSVPRVILLGDPDANSLQLSELLREYSSLTVVQDLKSLRDILRDEDIDLLVCAWSYDTGDWKDALSLVRLTRPDVPVIIFRHAGGDQEWIQVIGAGAFDLLAAPYHRNSVLPTVEQAVESRDARRLYPAPARNTARVV